jgi:hypothetical protein
MIKGGKTSLVYHLLEQVVQGIRSPKQRYRIASLNNKDVRKTQDRRDENQLDWLRPFGAVHFFRIQGFGVGKIHSELAGFDPPTGRDLCCLQHRWGEIDPSQGYTLALAE